MRSRLHVDSIHYNFAYNCRGSKHTMLKSGRISFSDKKKRELLCMMPCQMIVVNFKLYNYVHNNIIVYIYHVHSMYKHCADQRLILLNLIILCLYVHTLGWYPIYTFIAQCCVILVHWACAKQELTTTYQTSSNNCTKAGDCSPSAWEQEKTWKLKRNRDISR